MLVDCISGIREHVTRHKTKNRGCNGDRVRCGFRVASRYDANSILADIERWIADYQPPPEPFNGATQCFYSVESFGLVIISSRQSAS